MVICSVEGCDRVVLARGWCTRHYTRWLRYGDPLAVLLVRAEHGAPQEFIKIAIKHQDDKECLLWPYARASTGYAVLANNESGSSLVSRVVCEAVHGLPPSAKHQACHSCGKGQLGCVNPYHLRWDTQVGNEADKIIHGTHSKGERHNMAKLTWEKVREIRAMQGKLSGREVSAKFGVSPPTISLIWNGKIWRE